MKDQRSRKAVEVAERYGLGQATRDELAAAAYAAAAAAAAAYAAYAAAAAAAAAYAAYAAAAAYAYAADAAAYAAAYAAYAAAAAYAYAADAAAYADADARTKTLKQCADIVRAEYPNVDEFFTETAHRAYRNKQIKAMEAMIAANKQ
jgi:hypothetical protein